MRKSIVAAAAAITLLIALDAYLDNSGRAFVTTVATAIGPSETVQTSSGATLGAGPHMTAHPIPSSGPARTRSQIVDQLSVTGRPEDAFQAFRLLRDCVAARKLDGDPNPGVRLQTSAEICQDITPAQINGRAALIRDAAKAGVHGAFYAFAIQGPDGQGVTPEIDQDAAATKAWRDETREYQQAGAKTGDQYALMSLSNLYENEEPRDYGKSLMYWVAQNEIYKTENGGQDEKTYKAIVDNLSQKLTAEQVSQSIAAGVNLAGAAQKTGRQRPQ